MHSKTLLEGIWAGRVMTTQSRLSKEIIQLLKLMLPLHTVCLDASSTVTCSRIIPEEFELLPALPLGDIVAEELSMDVPGGAMIVILKEQDRKAIMHQSHVSYQLGLIIGDMLLSIIGDGVFPLNYEAKALQVMANSYCLLAENLERQHQKLCSTSFHNGLSHSVSEYWNGPPQNDLSTCKIREKVTSEMVLFGGYLKVSNHYVWIRESNQKSINLAEMHGKLRNLDTWKNDIVEAIMGEILSDTSHVYNH